MKNLDQLIEIMEEQDLKPLAKNYARATGLGVEEEGIVGEVLQEMGFLSFVSKNSIELVFNEEQIENYIKYMNQIVDLKKQMTEAIGDEAFDLLTETILEKSQQWVQANEEEFVEKLQDKLFNAKEMKA